MAQRKTAQERLDGQLQRAFDESDKLPQGDQEEVLAPDIPPDRTRQFQHVNFSRMRTSWLDSDQVKVEEMGRRADQVLNECFPEAWRLIESIFLIVREPEASPFGEGPLRDPLGRIRWKRDDRGAVIEDWSRLGDKERSNILDQLTVYLVEWEQQAAAMWGSAMFAKGIWEETFAFGYTSPRGQLTIDDRTQRGHLVSIEERYFAIFESILSRRADALVRSLTRIYNRLMKDA